jgi:hypothetical protein
MKTYVTFGQDHLHRINGNILDKDCVAIVDGDRDKVFELFGSKFCFEYPEDQWDDAKMMMYFPRGYITLQEES